MSRRFTLFLVYIVVLLPGPVRAQEPGVAEAGKLWGEMEALLWWVRPAYVPPLVTAGTTDRQGGLPGALGTPGTVVLVGNERVLDEARIGTRLTVGAWLDEEQTCRVNASFFLLESASSGFRGSSAGLPVLTRPFFNTATQRNDSQLVAFPGVLAGTVEVNSSSSELLGGAAWFQSRIVDTSSCHSGTPTLFRLSGLMGYRYLRLHETLTIRESLLVTGVTQQTAPGTTITVFDSFAATNQFHGADLGLAAERLCENSVGRVK